MIKKNQEAYDNAKDLTKLSPDEKGKYMLDRKNKAQGELHLIDDINCDICLNKGQVFYLENEETYVRDCECLIQRKIKREIKNSGLELLFKSKTFDNFETLNNWQKNYKDKAIKYLDEKDSWLMIWGITGSGKTHLATAISKALIDKGNTYAYMQYTNEIIELANGRNNYDENIKNRTNLRFKQLTTVDVLYIDDFLKADKNTNERSLNIVFDLINSRYVNNLKTIITTEFSPNQLQKYNQAIIGRIVEKAGDYIIGSLDNDRNIRQKGARDDKRF